MFCSKCGKEIDNNAKFCMACGNPTETGADNTPMAKVDSVAATIPVVQPVVQPAFFYT